MDGASYFDAKDVLESPMEDNGQAYTELDAKPVVIPETKVDPTVTDVMGTVWPAVEIIAPAVEKAFVAAFAEVEKKLEKSAPIPSSPIKVLSQIPINSEILLHGEVYWQNPTSFDWELATADKIQVVVVGLETVDNVVHLMCKVNGGQALWSVLQSDVLEGKYRVVKLANSVPTTSPIPPPNGKREFVESAEELYKKALAEFLPIFNMYLEAKERLEVAEKMFADIHEENYQTIENFVLQYGETVEDEGDTSYCVLEEDGVRLRLVEGAGLIFEKI
jgi:hypothetical protein